MRLPFPRRPLPSSGSGPVTPSLPADEENAAVRGPVLREPRPASWWIVPAALLVGGTVAVVAWWLLGGLPGTLDAYQAVTARRGAVQTALAAGGGIGAAITVMLAFRRQRHQEQTALITSLHADRAAALAERVAEHTRHDAVERRVTELYTKAAEQLGSDKAAVRLAGLYALKRLAQDNPGHRQTIVNVICAYLRMPYTPPPQPDPVQDRAQALRDARRRHRAQQAAVRAGHASPPAPQADAHAPDTEGERQVRLTAQTILADHLRDHRTPQQRQTGKATDPRFWEDMHIDLTGAILIAPDFNHCHPATAVFSGATFAGGAVFTEATFAGDAQFNGVSFAGDAMFIEVSFAGDAGFRGASFAGIAGFSRASFASAAVFDEVSFAGETVFIEVSFAGDAWFRGASFASAAWFSGASFASAAWFSGASFASAAEFIEVSFARDAEFSGASFARDAEFDDAVVAVPGTTYVWPQGWRVAVRPDGTGRLEETDADSGETG